MSWLPDPGEAKLVTNGDLNLVVADVPRDVAVQAATAIHRGEFTAADLGQAIADAISMKTMPGRISRATLDLVKDKL